MSRKYEDSTNTTNKYGPSAYLLGTHDNDLIFGRNWWAHRPETRADDGLIRLRALEQALAEMWKQGSGYICPNLAPGPIPGSRLFDPVRCDCLKYQGKQETSWDRPPAEWRTVSTCRINRDACLRDMKIPLKERDLDTTHQCYTDMPRGKKGRANILNTVTLQFCRKDRNCVVLKYASCFKLGADENGRWEHMNEKWHQNIDRKRTA